MLKWFLFVSYLNGSSYFVEMPNEFECRVAEVALALHPLAVASCQQAMK